MARVFYLALIFSVSLLVGFIVAEDMLQMSGEEQGRAMLVIFSPPLAVVLVAIATIVFKYWRAGARRYDEEMRQNISRNPADPWTDLGDHWSLG